MSESEIHALALKNQQRARRLIKNLGIVECWESQACEIHLVGSLKTDLLMKHRDIDFHIYSDHPSAREGFAVISKLCENHAVKRVEYGNLLETEEKCLEYHVWVEDDDGALWQIDMIHIERGSFYDGFMEHVAKRISAVLTPESRLAILSLKNDTPDSEKIMGIEYYVAVLRDGIREYADFVQWRKDHPASGVVQWCP